MAYTQAQIENKVDIVINQYQMSGIKYYPLTSTGTPDIYKQQKAKTFGTAVTLVGRAIHKPAQEMIMAIVNGQTYDIAFLFSRLEMVRKLPAAVEGEWIQEAGEIEWRGRRYKIEKVKPSGQVNDHFALLLVFACTIPGHRDS
jgi:hypothetical protein